MHCDEHGTVDYCPECVKDETVADLKAKLEEAQRWKFAVDNELVCCHLGTTDTMEPAKAIASIGRWHYDLGVSGVCEQGD